MNRLTKAIKTVRQLGLKQSGLFAVYKLGILSGHYSRVLAEKSQVPDDLVLETLLSIPSKDKILSLLGANGLSALVKEANLIVDEGRYRQFGAEYVPILLKPPVGGDLLNWTAYETGKAKVNTEDIKFVWEPARFGWAVPLARAALLTGESKYTEKFWQLFDEFNRENHYCKGPNWQSGQEVAIRLVTVLFCAPIFLLNGADADSHRSRLIEFIVEHATRIPPTLVYARAQHNNHLVTEALGLLCAGYALPDHPQAELWRKMGRRWLGNAFRSQITKTGEYIQYSNNYHRVMLQSAILATAVLRKNGDDFSIDVLEKLKLATQWLSAEVDQISGQVANYGHNDGAYLFPFANGDFADYRPVVQAASEMFFQSPAVKPGPWDEMKLWFGIESSNLLPQPTDSEDRVTTLYQTWAKMRGRFYTTRPGHADQNHVDLWWMGEAIALDAGTYRYNAEFPWDNQLMGTAVHNTITVNSKDQMTRAGRFLWLDWSDGRVIKESAHKLLGYHNGYDRMGVMHKRTVEFIEPVHWVIEDELIPRLVMDKKHYEIQLHWLLPDWEWTLDETVLTLKKENRSVVLKVACDGDVAPEIQVCRGGEVISGNGSCIPQMGWYSPTYSVKEPALSFVSKLRSHVPVRITSDWTFVEH